MHKNYKRGAELNKKPENNMPNPRTIKQGQNQARD